VLDGGGLTVRPKDTSRREHWFPSDPRTIGTDPDYRFSLANERTLLAWIRTALALMAGGLGALTILDEFAGSEVLGIMLLVLSFLTSATAYRRWAFNERAMRLDKPLPPSRLPQLITVGVAVVGVASAVFFVVDVR
jgi:putative membrane protein